MRTTEQSSRYDNLDKMSTNEILTSINFLQTSYNSSLLLGNKIMEVKEKMQATELAMAEMEFLNQNLIAKE